MKIKPIWSKRFNKNLEIAIWKHSKDNYSLSIKNNFYSKSKQKFTSNYIYLNDKEKTKEFIKALNVSLKEYKSKFRTW